MLGSCTLAPETVKPWHLLLRVEKLSRSRLTEVDQPSQDTPDLFGPVKAFSPPQDASLFALQSWPMQKPPGTENAFLQKLLKCT